MSKKSYEQGVVLITCDGCKKRHLIADNLGWFGPGRENIETILREQASDP
jgi:protein import protein ZIM17